MYTANTMACVTEALGMSLPGTAATPAVMSEKRRLAFETGVKIVELVRKKSMHVRYLQKKLFIMLSQLIWHLVALQIPYFT